MVIESRQQYSDLISKLSNKNVFATAVSDTSILSSGTFALLTKNDGSFSLQEITTGRITLREFDDNGRSASDFFSNDANFVLDGCKFSKSWKDTFVINICS